MKYSNIAPVFLAYEISQVCNCQKEHTLNSSSDWPIYMSVRMHIPSGLTGFVLAHKQQQKTIIISVLTALVFLAYEIILVCNRQEELTVKLSFSELFVFK